eukprot:gene9729-3080_t
MCAHDSTRRFRVQGAGLQCYSCENYIPTDCYAFRCRTCIDHKMCMACAKLAHECPGKHTLQDFVTYHDGFCCDGCGHSIPFGRPLKGCRRCDYDVCFRCLGIEEPDVPNDDPFLRSAFALRQNSKLKLP